MSERIFQIILIVGFASVATASFAESEIHGSAARKLQESRLKLDQPASEEFDPVASAFETMNGQVSDWSAVSELKDPEAKIEYMQQYLLLGARVLEMSREEDAAESLKVMWDLDKKLFAKELTKLPKVDQERIRSRVNGIQDGEDRVKKKVPVDPARDAASTEEVTPAKPATLKQPPPVNSQR